ncbi:MAG: hypothetical protein QOF89_6002 [Acidobacteriota bacterium]|jgi:hypothetical protein|nr:hypothetical protein [Acidobacteriota bacterium]
MTLDPEADTLSFSDALARFFRAPFRLQTYANLLYLALAFPLGLAYFIFLTVGLPLGYALTFIWIGIPILGLVFAGSWWMSALERRLAIGLLGAEVPPMAPPPSPEAQGFWQRMRTFFSNPVTWKGMGYLLLKLPMGVISFTALVTMLSLSVSLILVPILWPWAEFSADVDLVIWGPATFGGALVVGLIGAVLLLVSLNLFNGLAFLWRELAVLMLGSPRFAAPAPPPQTLNGTIAPATA